MALAGGQQFPQPDHKKDRLLGGGDPFWPGDRLSKFSQKSCERLHALVLDAA